MIDHAAIRVIGLSKRYRFRDRQRRYLDAGRRVDHEEVWAVRDVGFEVGRGTVTGIIGTNGSGKSTLLRLVSGVTRATTGAVETHGTVRGLLELGDNFNPLLTGAENALSDLLLEGLSRREAIDLLPGIADFAGLAGRLDQPLRSYSSGMRLRLAFATATAVACDVVIVDELLAVGDGHFQEKCINRLNELRDSGSTILLTSHSIDHVTRLCDVAMWMVDGRAKEIGDAREVADHYQGMLTTAALDAPPDGARAGTLVRIGAIEARNERGGRVTALNPGSPLLLNVDFEVLAAGLSGLIIEVSIQREGAETPVIEANTESDEFPLLRDVGPHTLELRWERLDLAGGRYHVHVGAYSTDWQTTLAYAWDAASVVVTGEETAAPIAPPRQWKAIER